MLVILPVLNRFLCFLPELPDLNCLPLHLLLIFPDVASHIFILVPVFLDNTVKSMSLEPGLSGFASQLYLASCGSMGKLISLFLSFVPCKVGLKIVPFTGFCEN